MTNPAEKKQLNTHGPKNRHFTHVKPTKPASKATKPMVAPAEKIRQVVEDFLGAMYLEEDFSGKRYYSFYRQDVDALVVRVLDVLHQEADMKAETVYQDYPNEAAHIQHGRIAAYLKFAKELKEARTSITNSVHE